MNVPGWIGIGVNVGKVGGVSGEDFVVEALAEGTFNARAGTGWSSEDDPFGFLQGLSELGLVEEADGDEPLIA